MAAPRFLARIAGRTKQIITIAVSAGAADAEKVPSTNASGVLDPTILNAKNASAGAGDAGKIPQLDAAGRLHTSFMPVGIGADVKVAPASEALTAGDLVNLWNDGGTLKARKADATAEGKECIGFVLENVAQNSNATVYLEGTNNARAGLTIGARYYLGTTPGGLVTAALTGSGNVDQYVGFALSTTELSFEPDDPVTIA
ncbi:MAG TPA: hypothetical protein VFE72_02795 [Lysobacter sp.]|nr:hypothetical protein [Lysobacter sp.]